MAKGSFSSGISLPTYLGTMCHIYFLLFTEIGKIYFWKPLSHLKLSKIELREWKFNWKRILCIEKLLIVGSDPLLINDEPQIYPGNTLPTQILPTQIHYLSKSRPVCFYNIFNKVNHCAININLLFYLIYCFI